MATDARTPANPNDTPGDTPSDNSPGVARRPFLKQAVVAGTGAAATVTAPAQAQAAKWRRLGLFPTRTRTRR